MKIYAIRDRLVDYFMTPFAAHEDQGVLNSIANLVSNEESNDPVKQAPHHFEIWRLAEIDSQGHIHVSREFLADCSALVRAAAPARRESSSAGAREIPGITGSLRQTAPNGSGEAGTAERPAKGEAQAEDQSGAAPTGRSG